MALETKILEVVGERTIHCGGCENAVQFALRQLPGVRRVEASHKTQRIRLIFDPQMLDIERIRRELDWLGYQIAEAEEGR